MPTDSERPSSGISEFQRTGLEFGGDLAHAGGLAKGERAGDYEVCSLLSRGGMGAVYLAENIHTHQPAVLKLILRQFTGDAFAVERFACEARATGLLRHSNVIGVYESGKCDAGLYLAMEWVDGKTLRALMKAGIIGLGYAADWSRQAAEGLAAAHEAGITHRDIKPDNIMVSKEGVVKILDFGLARLPGPVQPDPVSPDMAEAGAFGTISGTLSGTLSYLSPEQFRGEPATSATDVFSLGAVLYELFTGRHPFRGETPLDVYEAIECRTPDTPSSLRAGITPELDRLLLAMLDREPQGRPAASEVGRLVTGCLGGSPS
jgi:serine/threonine-protein kinase